MAASIVASFCNCVSGSDTRRHQNSLTEIEKESSSSFQDVNEIKNFSCLINKYRFGIKLGNSCDTKSSVYCAEEIDKQQSVAIKCINLEMTSISWSLIETELKIMKEFKHSNILTYYCTFTSGINLFVIMPFLNFGSCAEIIKNHFIDGLPEITIAYILKEALRAIAYLHKCNVLHRSIQARHILVGTHGRVKLSGLHHCYSIDNFDQEYSPVKRSVHNFPDENYKASLNYASPEVLEQNLAGYSTKSDIYSFGITACELFNGKQPYTEMPPSKMLLMKIKGIVPFFTNEQHSNDDSSTSSTPLISSVFRKLICKCLEIDIHNRPRATELLHDEFFKITKKQHISKVLTDLLLPLKPISNLDNTALSETLVSNLFQNLSLEKEVDWIF